MFRFKSYVGEIEVGWKNVVVMSVYAPRMERKGDEREIFWARFSECLAGSESNCPM